MTPQNATIPIVMRVQFHPDQLWFQSMFIAQPPAFGFRFFTKPLAGSATRPSSVLLVASTTLGLGCPILGELNHWQPIEQHHDKHHPKPLGGLL